MVEYILQLFTKEFTWTLPVDENKTHTNNTLEMPGNSGKGKNRGNIWCNPVREIPNNVGSEL